MSTRARKGGKEKEAARDDYERRLREMNDALLVSSALQNESIERAEHAAKALRQSQDRLQELNESLERRVAERTAELTWHQQRLRALVRELREAETRERKRVASDLHDNLAQLLAVCKMRVSAIEAWAPPDSATAREALAVKHFLGQGLEYTRTLMSDLRPEVLDGQDLNAAMEWVARRMEQHGLVVRVEDDGDPTPVAEELLTLIFDSVRELLFNVVKHAAIGEATISLRHAGDSVRVTVSDAGAGFDSAGKGAAPSGNGGFGLFSIRERISLVGGEVAIESAPGRGTNARLTVPLSLPRGGRPPARWRGRQKERR